MHLITLRYPLSILINRKYLILAEGDYFFNFNVILRKGGRFEYNKVLITLISSSDLHHYELLIVDRNAPRMPKLMKLRQTIILDV